MRVVFRVDASLEVGSGHLMRCLTLATALAEKGAECLFICREHLGHMADFVEQKGFEVMLLPKPVADWKPQDEGRIQHAAWLGCDWQTDAEQTQQSLPEGQIDWLVVDHYALDAGWESVLRACCKQIMVINDLADRQHDCDLLLDQTLGRLEEDYAQLVSKNCTLLTGSQYALLRPEFAQLREVSLQRRVKPQLKRILISMGGVDQHNATGAVLAALNKYSLPQECQITVVMGGQAPWLQAVQEQAKQMRWLTTVQVSVDNMAQLMTESDLAIGAAGSSSWERCCLGLPTLMVVLAENQRYAAKKLQAAGGAQLLFLDDQFMTHLEHWLAHFNQDLSQLSEFSRQTKLISDGAGAGRVIKLLLQEQL